MKTRLDFGIDDCIIVKSLDDDDMSLTYSTPVGDFVLTISRGDAVVEWNGIIPAPDNIIPQAEKILVELRSQEFQRFYNNSLRKLRRSL